MSMFIREWGTGDRTALLVHGLASSSSSWETLAKDLVTQGYKVVAPDLHGHGLSARLPRYSVKRWVNAITSRIHPETAPELIVGHSMGGLIASKLQHVYNPSHTVMIDPVYRLPATLPLQKITQHIFRQVMAEMNRRSTNEHQKQTLAEWDPRTVEALRVTKEDIEMFKLQDTTALIMRSSKSYIMPKHVKVVTVPNAGHNIHMDNYPAVKRNILNYLQTVKENILEEFDIQQKHVLY